MIYIILAVVVYILTGLVVMLREDRKSRFGLHSDYALRGMFTWPLYIFGVFWDLIKYFNRRLYERS